MARKMAVARRGVLAEAGQSLAPAPRPTPAMHRVGGRVRATFRAPPLPGARLPDLVMEFEPTVSNQLMYGATRNFVFSIAAAAALAALRSFG